MEQRSADDVVLLTRQGCDIRTKPEHLSAASAKLGLKINFAKTTVMTASASPRGLRTMQVNGREVAILDETESEKYLGRPKLCFGNVPETELQNRVALVWAAFHKHEAEFCIPVC